MPAPAKTHDYAVDRAFYDEAFVDDGIPRPHYERLLDALADADLRELERGVAHDLHSRGVSFGAGGGDGAFRVDPVPRLIPAEEWEPLADGLAQRARALNAFLADAYGERRIVAAGVVPARVIEGAELYEPLVRGLPDVTANVAGLDVIRGPDGEFLVLEDNLRTPSGLAYAEAARDVLEDRLPGAAHEPKRSVGAAIETLAAALAGAENPVLLSDGPANSAWWEHRAIARRLRLPIVALADLEARGGRLCARVDGGPRRPVDVVYRRTDEDRLSGEDGRLTPLGERLLDPLRAGTLRVVNGFGTGLGDDKLVHAYVEEMIRFYLGEEPLLRSVPTYDLALPDVRAEALARLDELVVKPRTGHGGYGVLIGPHARRADVEATARAVRARPERFVAQETVAFSRHPTVCGGRLAPRHVDLRPFVVTAGDEVHVVPGGLTRVAFGAGALVVNSSQNGGAKDTWALD